MITAKAIWTDKERYIAEATSHHAIVMDTATEKTANSPMELVLIALCGCTASDVVGILRKKREPFTSLEVSASGRAGIGLPGGVYRNQAGLSHRRQSFSQSGGRCGAALEREILLGLRHAGKDREDYVEIEYDTA